MTAILVRPARDGGFVVYEYATDPKFAMAVIFAGDQTATRQWVERWLMSARSAAKVFPGPADECVTGEVDVADPSALVGR